MIAENKNLTEDEIKQIKENVTIKRTMLGENIEENDESMFLQIISNYLIFFVLLLGLLVLYLIDKEYVIKDPPGVCTESLKLLETGTKVRLRYQVKDNLNIIVKIETFT